MKTNRFIQLLLRFNKEFNVVANYEILSKYNIITEKIKKKYSLELSLKLSDIISETDFKLLENKKISEEINIIFNQYIIMCCKHMAKNYLINNNIYEIFILKLHNNNKLTLFLKKHNLSINKNEIFNSYMTYLSMINTPIDYLFLSAFFWHDQTNVNWEYYHVNFIYEIIKYLFNN